MAVPEYIPPQRDDIDPKDKINCDNCFVSILLCSIYVFIYVIWGIVSIKIPSFEFDWQRDLMGIFSGIFILATFVLPVPGVICGIISLKYNILCFRRFINQSKAIGISIVCIILNLISIGIVVWYISAWFNM